MASDVLDDVSISQKLTGEFIDAYEACPELWDPRHEHYTNKYRRIQAQEKLLEVYKKICSNATRVDVRAKINTMRSNYNKIAAKVKAAEAEGIKYVPTNWMFHKLRFLEATKKPERIKSTEDEESCNDESEMSHDVNVKSPGTPTIATEYVDIDELPQESLMYHPSPTDSNKPIQQYKLEKRKIQKRLRKQDFQTHRSPKSIQLYNRSSTAGIEPIALVWSSKLQALEPKQRLLAEKAINDILFEASMKSLRKGTVSESEATVGLEYCSTDTGFGLEAPKEYMDLQAKKMKTEDFSYKCSYEVNAD